MKKVMFVFGMFASVVLVSCGDSSSGNRVPAKASRAREVYGREVNFIRLNQVEQGIYRVGDTLKMNGNTHTVVYNLDEIVKLKYSGMLKIIIIEK